MNLPYWNELIDHTVHFLYSNFICLAIGKNFSSSSHTDPDVGYTFEGSFSIGPGEASNSFCFPEYQARVVLKEKDVVELFLFNSAVLHSAEKVKRDKGTDSYLFSLYTSQIVARLAPISVNNKPGCYSVQLETLVFFNFFKYFF